MQQSAVHVHFHFHALPAGTGTEAAGAAAAAGPAAAPYAEPATQAPAPDARNASFTRTLFRHVQTVVPQAHGPECAMRFMSATGACIAGSAAVKSVARVAARDRGEDASVYGQAALALAQRPSLHGTLNRDSDVDFWVPHPTTGAASSDPACFLEQQVLRCFGPAICGKPVLGRAGVGAYAGASYGRLDRHVASILTLTCPAAVGPWPPLQFMLLCPRVSVEDAVRAFDIRALQLALGFQHRQSVADQAAFVRACDVTASKSVLEDLRRMRVTINDSVVGALARGEWVRTLRRVVKYVRDYGWTVTEEELLRMKAAYAEQLLAAPAGSRTEAVLQWNEVCHANADVVHPMIRMSLLRVHDSGR